MWTEKWGHTIATRPELTVRLDNDTATEVVQNQRLVSLGKTQFPGQTGVLDTGPAGGAGTTIVTRDQDVVSLGLGDTRSDNTDTSLGDKLDGDARPRASALEVVDELLQVLDRVNWIIC